MRANVHNMYLHTLFTFFLGTVNHFFQHEITQQYKTMNAPIHFATGLHCCYQYKTVNTPIHLDTGLKYCPVKYTSKTYQQMGRMRALRGGERQRVREAAGK